MKYFVKIVWTIFLKKENISIRMLRIMGYYICFWNKEILLDRKNTREYILENLIKGKEDFVSKYLEN